KLSCFHGEKPTARTVIGGRHGSPSLTIALPFAKITSTDSELRDVVAELATLVAELASAVSSGDAAESVSRARPPRNSPIASPPDTDRLCEPHRSAVRRHDVGGVTRAELALRAPRRSRR